MLVSVKNLRKKVLRNKINLFLASLGDPQSQECEHPEYAGALSCIHRELFRSCPIKSNDSTCIKIKNFLRRCPSKKDILFDME